MIIFSTPKKENYKKCDNTGLLSYLVDIVCNMGHREGLTKKEEKMLKFICAELTSRGFNVDYNNLNDAIC